MMDVTLQNFEAEVVNASLQVPVLVDFWAPWCGPCKTLGPLLEKLETEYDGRLKLVKINVDEQQQLAGMFGIRSVPTCVLMLGGQPVDGFAGALPEGQLRAFLDKHIPSEAELAAEAEADEAQSLLESGDVAAALQKLGDALAADPKNDDARFDYVRLLISEGGWEEATALLHEPLQRIPRPQRFEALQHWMQALQYVQGSDRAQWQDAQFDALIAANRRDFDARFDKARVQVAQGRWPEALEEMLEIIMRDKAWGDQAPRKLYVALLELMTPPKPKATDAVPGKTQGGIELLGKGSAEQDAATQLVNTYRRKLSMALN